MPSRHLTKEQLAAIILAKKSGLSKRELFEADVQGRIFSSLSKEEQDKAIDRTLRGLPTHPKMQQMKISTIDKALAIRSLQKNEEAKRAFIKEDSLRLEKSRARELR